MRKMITVLATAASAMLVGALGVPVLLSALAPRFGLRPEPLSPPRTDPALWGLPWGEEVRFRAADGVSLHGWWIPAPRAARACGTVILFHGRSANITTRAGIAAWLSGLGYNSLLFDYRGYGASGGSPSEAGLYRDGLSAYRFVRDVQREQPGRIILLGQSMGTAIATEVAVRRPAASLVLVSPFTDVPALVRARLPGAPAHWPDWRNNRFETKRKMARISIPVVVAATRADEQVPYRNSREVFEAASGPKHWIELADMRHDGFLQSAALQRELGPVIRQAVRCPRP
jgi:fermentation-respiration switch protein FrsA (DUF1100 family)